MYVKILKPDFVFQDERGSLTQLVRRGYTQFNVITSVADSLRGGHYHKLNSEAFYVIDGEIKLELWKDGDTQKEEHLFKNGDMFEIPAGIIHSFFYPKKTTLVSMYSKGVELDNGEKDIIAVS